MNGVEILATKEIVANSIFNWSVFWIAFGVIFGVFIVFWNYYECDISRLEQC